MPPTVVLTPPIGPGLAHELKHDGYRLQIHVRDGRVRLYTKNGADWTTRYPRIVEEAARLPEPLIIDAEVVCLSDKGVADFDILHSRTADEKAVALASIFFSLVTISVANRLLSARTRYSGCCAKRARASSTSRLLMTTDRKCSMPSASSAWRARF